MKPMKHCASVVSAMPVLIDIEKKTWLMSHFLDQGDRQPPELLSLTMLHPWANLLILVREAPSLSQTGCKSYSYSPWAVIRLKVLDTYS